MAVVIMMVAAEAKTEELIADDFSTMTEAETNGARKELLELMAKLQTDSTNTLTEEHTQAIEEMKALYKEMNL
eukprot:CAMPEP_0117425042 /NCGR_PEP_ID=MMETSP0758-20121206/5363_1 /TAXON_ID=63605 /ORGANISM="Percolomonas cosmopolitus, Strain AE-1 (ATCC 50343)" /LENGTH=72 /DNA_ID=CAMNT_0005209229 /DNA_START=46 /DNA_END=264 /DNA_ORIENTATION=+